jgi:hypothetical protein
MERIGRASAILIAATAAAAKAATSPIDPAKLAHGYDFADAQLSASVAALAPGQFPAVTTATGQWLIRGPSDWRAGFFPGQLWRMYESSGAPAWRDQAVSRTDHLATPSITHDHDIGFVTIASWGQALRLGPTRAYRDTARSNILANAQILADRFKPAMGLIDSWDTLEEPNGVCIDNMMNLELLLSAHAQAGDEHFREVAVAHAQTALQQFVRADGSTYHIVRHEEDGSIERKSTRQGYGDETTWSRGQAWAIHGFGTMYQHTREPAFLTTAQRTADYFIAHLPHHLDPLSNPMNAQAGDWVPPSDFDAELGEPLGALNDADNDGNPGEINSGNRPGTPPGSTPYVNDRLLALNTYTLRDSSAAAVAASGLFRLAMLVPNDTPANQALRQTYFDTARNILDSLLTHHNANPKLNYLADGASGTGGPLVSILARGSEQWNGPGLGTSYGDYYFLEALSRYEQAGLDFLPLAIGNQWAGGDGNWTDNSHWTAGAPAGGIGQAAHFRTLASDATTVTLIGLTTVGGLTFNSAQKYSLAGIGPLHIEHAGEAQITVEASPALGHEIAAPLILGGDASVTIAPDAALTISGALIAQNHRVTKLGDGRMELTGPQLWSSGGILRVAAGTLKVHQNLGLAGPVVQLVADGGTTRLAGVQALASLEVNPNAKVDLDAAVLIVRAADAGTWNGSAYTGLAGLVDSGRGDAPNALWDGTGGVVTSDPRAIGNGDLVSLGVSKVSDVRNIAATATTLFAGQTVLGSDVIAMTTWGGDANLDGKINIDDYGRIDGSVAQSGSVFGYFNGDFNYDGKINIDDYGIIDGNIERQGFPFLVQGIAAVPEPAVGGLLVGLLWASIWPRRRRFRHFRGQNPPASAS